MTFSLFYFILFFASLLRKAVGKNTRFFPPRLYMAALALSSRAGNMIWKRSAGRGNRLLSYSHGPQTGQAEFETLITDEKVILKVQSLVLSERE